MSNSARNDRRWNPGSWIAFAFALFILVYNLSSIVVIWSVPTDGWLTEDDRLGAGEPRVVYVTNVVGLPSDLRADDALVAVNGIPLADLLLASHQFYRQQAPQWEDGHALQYTVLRDQARLTLAVPIRRVGPVESMLAGARYAGVTNIALQIISSLLFFGIGWFVFLMRPREPAAYALLFLGVAFFFQALHAFPSTPSVFYPLASRFLSQVFNYWTCVIIPSLIYLMLAFPKAKFPLNRFPRATPVVLYSFWSVLFVATYLLNLDSFTAYDALALPIAISGLLVLVPTLILFVVSFGRERDGVARAQYKWMALGLLGFIGIGIAGWFLGVFIVGRNELVIYIATVGWLLLPISLAFAITRTRLFDIDLIIRRTLQYTLLSGLLALVYFGLIIVLQSAFTAITGQAQNDFVTVASTLAIAALFLPLRRRVQDVIDRRFYRKKYDAAKVIADFAATCRDETDLEKLTARLVEVVQETMQPESVTLWLKPSGRGKKAA